MFPKTIFITIYDGLVESVMLRSSVLRILKESGSTTILLVSAKKLEHFKKNWEDGESVFVEALPNPYTAIEKTFYYISLHSIPTFSIKLLKQYRLLEKKRYDKYLVASFLHFFGRFMWWRGLIRLAYRLWPDNYTLSLFEKWNPDLVVLPNLISEEDYRLMKTAKKRDIKTLGLIKSWDNITTKTFLRMHPDILLVQNEIVRREARDICDYPVKNTRIVGMPHWDHYFSKSFIEPREKFFEKIGLDPARKLIFYGSPGDWMAPYDHEVVEDLHKAMHNGRLPENLQLLVRLHPKYGNSLEKSFAEDDDAKMERPGHYARPDKLTSWYFDDGDIKHLANSIYHADITCSTSSSLAVEASILDKPIINIAYDGNHTRLYKYSISRLSDREHILPLLESDGISTVGSAEEMVAEINKYLSDPSYKKEGRNKIVEKELYWTDGKSGERIAKEILRCPHH